MAKCIFWSKQEEFDLKSLTQKTFREKYPNRTLYSIHKKKQKLGICIPQNKDIWNDQNLSDLFTLKFKDFTKKYPEIPYFSAATKKSYEKKKNIATIENLLANRKVIIPKEVKRTEWSDEELSVLKVNTIQDYYKSYRGRNIHTVIEKKKEINNGRVLDHISILTAGQKAAITRKKNRELRELEAKKVVVKERTSVDVRFEELVKYARSL